MLKGLLLPRHSAHTTTTAPSTLSPHALQFSDQLCVNLLVAGPFLAETLHALRCNHGKSDGLEGTGLGMVGRIGRDSHFLNQLEVFSITVEYGLARSAPAAESFRRTSRPA